VYPVGPKKKEYGWVDDVCVLCRTQEGGSDRVNDPAFPVTISPPPQLKPYVHTYYFDIYNNNNHIYIYYCVYAHRVAATAVTAEQQLLF